MVATFFYQAYHKLLLYEVRVGPKLNGPMTDPDLNPTKLFLDGTTRHKS